MHYLGNMLSDKCGKSDPKKIKAIEEFATPKCREYLERILCMGT